MPDKVKSEAQLRKERELRRLAQIEEDDYEYELSPKDKYAEKVSKLRRSYLDE